MLRDQLPPPQPRPRRGVAPRAILVAAVTAAIAAGLGSTGAFGYATSSLHNFSDGVIHIVSQPTHWSNGNTSNGDDQGNQGGQGKQDNQGNQGGFDGSQGQDTQTSDGNSQGNRDNDPDFFHIPPFQFQYGIFVPICLDGHIVFVPFFAYFYFLLHGGQPVQFCFRRFP